MNPYDKAKENWNNKNKEWVEINQEIFNEQLGCVPPLRMGRNFFIVGEEWDFDDKGAIHACFIEHGKRFFMKLIHVREFSLPEYEIEIENQFNLVEIV